MIFMAIQLPDPGTGVPADKTGDSPWLAMKKVRENFNDQSNAASRLVGNGAGQLAQWSAANGIESTGIGGIAVNVPASTAGNRIKEPDIPYVSALYKKAGPLDAPTLLGLKWQIVHLKHDDTNSSMLLFSSDNRDKSIYLAQKTEGVFGGWIKFYGTGNTTIVNGSIKPSSPVVKVHTDSLELNDDAVRMGVTLNKRGVGDYLLQNTTGLRNDGGWRIELPQDVNGNPYFAVDYNELENNDIEVKTYRRIFDMNTFMFVPDFNNPVDIKEGRSIAIRFNDLPLDDFQTEV